MSGELDDKVVVVTGSSRGIGRGAAIAFGEKGATVYVTGRTTTGELSIGETVRMVNEAGGHGIAVEVDHGDDAQIARLFAQVGEEQGKLNVLVNNVYKIPNPPAWGLALAGIATLCCLGNRTFGIVAIGTLFLIPVTYMKSVAFPVLDRTVSARQAARKGPPACVDGSQRDLYYGLNYYLDVAKKLPVCGDHETPP